MSPRRFWDQQDSAASVQRGFSSPKLTGSTWLALTPRSCIICFTASDRRCPSAMLYSRLPRSSALPSTRILVDEFKPIVTAHARYLQQNPSTRIRVEGNADDRGSREYNIALGQRRSEAVKQMMQLLGARADQVEPVSFGEEKPRCTEAAESCWSQNRRGDIVYQGR